jgi:hypothetical protein
VLAYLLWHRPGEDVEPQAYERAAENFHRSLHHAPPAGFHGSALYRVTGLPWLGGADGYEDWYLLDDFIALGILNEAAVAHGHRSAHDEVARHFGGAAGGLYGLLEGNVDLLQAHHTIWVSRPPGSPRGTLAELLGDGIDREHTSLWRRALVFGPAPEYCLLTPAPPMGVQSTRMPDGWQALEQPRKALYNETRR